MITGVAIKEKKTGKYYSLPKPNRHGDIIHWVYENITNRKTVSHDDWIQGFVDDYGQFLTRLEAGHHAHQSGQIKKLTDCLFSEDVW